nr:family 1 glycosylhydrolase [Clostridium butyricum]
MVLRYLSRIILITENGLGDVDLIVDNEVLDIPRIKFIEAHLRGIKKVITEKHINIYSNNSKFLFVIIHIIKFIRGKYYVTKSNLKRKSSSCSNEIR